MKKFVDGHGVIKLCLTFSLLSSREFIMLDATYQHPAIPTPTFALDHHTIARIGIDKFKETMTLPWRELSNLSNEGYELFPPLAQTGSLYLDPKDHIPV